MSYVYFQYRDVAFSKSFDDVADGSVKERVLIEETTKLTHVKIHDSDKQKNIRSYTVTLYTNTWKISIDDTIDIINDKSRLDRDIQFSESVLLNGGFFVYLNLLNIESFRVTIKKKEQSDVLNEIQYIASPIDDETSIIDTVPHDTGKFDNCSECEKIKNEKIKEIEECNDAMQKCTKTGERNNELVSLMDTQNRELENLKEQMKECEQLQQQIDAKDIEPHNTGLFDDCAQCKDMLNECKDKEKSYEDTLNSYINNLTACQSDVDKSEADCKSIVDKNEAECKSKIEHENEACKSRLEMLQKKYEQNDTIYKSNIEQKHTDCENRISTIQQENNRDNERAAKTCIDTIHYWTTEKKSCDKREHDCRNQKNDLKRENEELKKQIGKKSNSPQTTPNSIIIICVVIIIFLLGMCIYLYFRTPFNV